MAIIAAGCNTIANLEPNQTETFLKFYSETNEMESKDLVVLNDGYLILSTYSESNTLLLKTDLLGNKIWAQSFGNFQGSSLAVLNDGYIIIGDGINEDNDSTFMQLIKTDIDGNFGTLTNIGTGAQHGSAVILTSDSEIVALGYTSTGQLNDTDDSTYVISVGFNTDLIQTWDTVRTNPVNSVDIVPSKSIYEANNGDLTWISYSSQDEVTTNLDFTAIPPNSESPSGNLPLFNEFNISNDPGDFVQTPIGFAMVQTVIHNGQQKIGLTTTLNGIISEEEIISLDGNSMAVSLTTTGNELLIIATTDVHPNETGRTDLDLLLLEVNYKGEVKPNGINVTFGGDGDEIPVRIRRTNDGGYAILGTLINTKGARQTFLLKTNNKGALN